MLQKTQIEPIDRTYSRNIGTRTRTNILKECLPAISIYSHAGASRCHCQPAVAGCGSSVPISYGYPLCVHRVVVRVGFEPTTRSASNYRSSNLSYPTISGQQFGSVRLGEGPFPLLPPIAATAGSAPATSALTERRSTVELHGYKTSI